MPNQILSRSQALRDIAACVAFYPEGVTVRQLVDKHSDLLFQAGIVDDEKAVKAVCQHLLSQTEQGFLTRTNLPGNNVWTYFSIQAPIIGTDGKAEESAEKAEPLESCANIAWLHSQQEKYAAIEKKLAELEQENPALIETLAAEPDLMMQRLEDAFADIREIAGEWQRHYHNEGIAKMRENAPLQHIENLRDMATHLRGIRPDWADSAGAAAYYLFSLGY